VAQSHTLSYWVLMKYGLPHEGHGHSAISHATGTVDIVHKAQNHKKRRNFSPNQNAMPTAGIRAIWIWSVLIKTRSLRNSSGRIIEV
jgi:hypothetical protein